MRPAHLAAFTALLTGSPAIAQSQGVELTTAQLFRMAEAEQAAGRSALAETLLLGLLADPRLELRSEARFRLARLKLAQGDRQGAVFWYRALLAEEPGARAVRVELARVLTAARERKAAARELRLARSADLPAEVARMADRLSAALRSTRPFGATLDVALAPNSNVNLGSGEQRIGTVLGDLIPDEDARPQSGTGLSLRALLHARIEARGTPLLLRLSGGGDLYRKKRFNDLSASFDAGPELHSAGGTIRLSLMASQRWFGNEPYARMVGASLQWQRPVSHSVQLEAEALVARARYRQPLQDGMVGNLQLHVDRRWSQTLSSRLSLNASRNTARDPAFATRTLGASAFAGLQLGGQTLVVEASTSSLRSDGRLALFPKRRKDQRVELGTSLLINRLEVANLVPTVRLRHVRNRSTLDVYSLRQTRIEFGMSREF